MVLDAVFVVIAFLGALVATALYQQIQPKWYKYENPRFFMGQSLVLLFIYLQAIVVVFFHVHYPRWANMALNGIVAALMVWHAITFYRTHRANLILRRKRDDTDQDPGARGQAPVRQQPSQPPRCD